jgi:hypothetical protein
MNDEGMKLDMTKRKGTNNVRKKEINEVGKKEGRNK